MRCERCHPKRPLHPPCAPQVKACTGSKPSSCQSFDGAVSDKKKDGGGKLIAFGEVRHARRSLAAHWLS